MFAESEDDGPITRSPFGEERHFSPEGLAESSTPLAPAFPLSRIPHIALSLTRPSRSCASCKLRNASGIPVVRRPHPLFFFDILLPFPSRPAPLPSSVEQGTQQLSSDSCLTDRGALSQRSRIHAACQRPSGLLSSLLSVIALPRLPVLR